MTALRAVDSYPEPDRCSHVIKLPEGPRRCLNAVAVTGALFCHLHDPYPYPPAPPKHQCREGIWPVPCDARCPQRKDRA